MSSLRKISNCRHCQKETSEDWADNCLTCGYHPWSICHNIACGRFPPIKHEPVKPPLRPRRSSPADSDPSKEKSG
ncbi:hypothetical protein F4802DRAFT_588586 [Xylaria palmicola]|nr:hypothetical protein F4802DRAFT_588586 [Xylaria palmicola]